MKSILLILVIIPCIVSATSNNTVILAGGNNETRIFFIYGFEQSSGASSVVEATNEGGSGGAGYRSPTKYYDLSIDLLDRSLNPGDVLQGIVTIDLQPLTQYFSDGVLEYTVIDPKGVEYAKTRETIAEGDNKIRVLYNLPGDARKGQWVFRATWTVSGIEPIHAQQSFFVGARISLKIVLLVAGVLVAVFGMFIVFKKKNDSGEESG